VAAVADTLFLVVIRRCCCCYSVAGNKNIFQIKKISGFLIVLSVWMWNSVGCEVSTIFLVSKNQLLGYFHKNKC
jgi:hypothetical protein